MLFINFFPLFIALRSVDGQSIIENLLDDFREAMELPLGMTRDAKTIFKEYDFVVVGAGSGGCVVTNRLTENSDCSVLLLEAGKEEIFLTDVPLLVSYLLSTGFNWGYRTEKQPDICMGMDDGRCSWPRGKAVGGTSVINYMVYTRGFDEDYDGWAAAGNVGWNSTSVRPYFLKYENMKVPEYFNSSYYSRGGYVDIERPSWRTPLAQAYIKTGARMGYQVGQVDGLTPRGFSYVLSTTRRGSRLSASKAFLRPIRDRPNLFVSKKSRVTKILIDPITKAAYGVEFVKNKRVYKVRARKEVILSAGTINSAQLLMLSGIGPARHLRDMKIPLLRDSNVGQNLQDHVSMMGLAFLINSSLSIVEDRYRSPIHTLNYLLYGRGPYTLPGGAEAFAFVDTEFNKNSKIPDMELVFGPGALTGDSGGSLRQGFHINSTFFDKTYGPYVGRDAFGIVPVLLKPKSKGFLRLRSKNPFHWPLLYPNYYSEKEDLERMIDGIKKVECFASLIL